MADVKRWTREVLEGKSATIQHIGECKRLPSGAVSRILPLAWLAAESSAAVLEGREGPHGKVVAQLPMLTAGPGRTVEDSGRSASTDHPNPAQDLMRKRLAEISADIALKWPLSETRCEVSSVISSRNPL